MRCRQYNVQQKPKVQERIAALSRKFEGVKLIVGVDRLDYIKGVPQKLHALEVFLTDGESKYHLSRATKSFSAPATQTRKDLDAKTAPIHVSQAGNVLAHWQCRHTLVLW